MIGRILTLVTAGSLIVPAAHAQSRPGTRPAATAAGSGPTRTTTAGGTVFLPSAFSPLAAAGGGYGGYFPGANPYLAGGYYGGMYGGNALVQGGLYGWSGGTAFAPANLPYGGMNVYNPMAQGNGFPIGNGNGNGQQTNPNGPQNASQGVVGSTKSDPQAASVLNGNGTKNSRSPRASTSKRRSSRRK
jgi:hypothetical protein